LTETYKNSYLFISFVQCVIVYISASLVLRPTSAATSHKSWFPWCHIQFKISFWPARFKYYW